MTAGSGGQLAAQAVDDVRREQDPAEEQHELRHELQDHERGHEAGEAGERVVAPAQGPGEVQRQDAVALVAPEQLRRLGRAEQDERDRDRG